MTTRITPKIDTEIHASFTFVAGLLFAIVFPQGGNLGAAATLILVPYFSETHVRFGKVSGGLLQAVPAVAQLGMLVLIFLIGRSNYSLGGDA